MSYRPERRKEDEELLELFRDEWERSSRFWPLLSALRHCVSWGEPIPAWLEQALTDPKQPYQIGFRDGYEQAKREIREATDLAVARIEAKTEALPVGSLPGSRRQSPRPPWRRGSCCSGASLSGGKR